MKTSVRFAGMGGQGIIFVGIVLARASALYEFHEGNRLYAIETHSHGPAARGESSKCDVVISTESDFYPFVDRPDYLVVMSQPAYERYVAQVSQRTIIILDEDMVEDRPDLIHYEIPGRKRAEMMARGESANMVMLGALVQLSGLVGKKAIGKAIADVSPMGIAESNEKAFLEGMRIAKVLQNLDQASADALPRTNQKEST